MRGIRPGLIAADEGCRPPQRLEPLAEPDPDDARFLERIERAHASVDDLERRNLGGGTRHQLLDFGELFLGRRPEPAQGRVHVARIYPTHIPAGATQARDGLRGGRFDLFVSGDGDEQAHKKLNYSS